MSWKKIKIRAQDWLEVWRLQNWLLSHQKQLEDLQRGLIEMGARIDVVTAPRMCQTCEAMLSHPYVLHESGAECLVCWRSKVTYADS